MISLNSKFLFSIAGAWIITVPASALIASLIYLFLDYAFI
jgi:phosphate/sulfate permease